MAKRTAYEKLFSRNIGFLSEKDQKKLSKLSIGIAGCGGDGGLTAERLVRFGVGKVVLADPDCFEWHNVNRQFAANSTSISKNKARIVANELKKINPNLRVSIYPKGINEKNIRKFVSESDVVVDEVEYTMPDVSATLAQESRRQKKFVFMGANVGWGASFFCFDPKGMTFEEYFKYDPDLKTIDPMQYVGSLPRHFSKRLLDKILNKKIPVPGLSSSVGLVASLVSSQVILFAIGKKRPETVPHALFFDLNEIAVKKRR